MKPNIILFTLKLVLRTSIFILLLIAVSFSDSDILASNKNLGTNQKNNFYILVDVSNSMNAKDIQPSRLEKVKFEIELFLKNKEAGKIGLIIFSETAKLISPLTDDLEVVSHYISSINSSMSDNGGSDLNVGLEKYLQLISKDKSSLGNLVLFTDGCDHINVDSKIVREIRSKGGTSIIVGVGSKKGSSVYDELGQLIKDENNQIVKSKLEYKQLLNLSTELNGKFSLIENNNSDINGLSDLIYPADKVSEISKNSLVNPLNYFVYILLATLILISLEILLKFDLIKL
jgi:Ca-activated chloride channel family protein